MSEGNPAEPFEVAAVAPKQAAALIRFGQTPDLDPTIHELVALRAPQLNGCAFCIDMHWLDARAGGEVEARLYGLDAWRESPLYDQRERAALALCEAVTQIDRAGVPDDVWAAAQAHFGEAELAQLLCAIASTNTWNRLQIATRALPGHYLPADREAAGGAAGSVKVADGAAAVASPRRASRCSAPTTSPAASPPSPAPPSAAAKSRVAGSPTSTAPPGSWSNPATRPASSR